MTQSNNKPYQDKLEALIKEGEELMQNVEDRRLYDEIKTHVDKLKVKLFKAKIDNEGVYI
jgi:ribosomal protein L16 Arg81 hydroxylase